MKKRLLFLFLLLLCIPSLGVNAADYTLKNNKNQSGTYAGEAEDAYNFYKVNPSKDGFIEITANTSDKKALVIEMSVAITSLLALHISITNAFLSDVFAVISINPSLEGLTL